MSAEQSLPIVLPLVNGKGTKVAKPFYAPGLNNGNHATLPNVQTTYHGNDLDDLFDSKTAARELVNFIVLKYLTTAVSSPFEVSKTLLQVQYMPREDSEVTATAKTKISVNSDDKQKQQQFVENSEENRDERRSYVKHRRGNSSDSTSTNKGSVDIPMDDSGYAIRTSVYDDTTRPSHQIKPIKDGVWEGIRALLKQPHEGWSSLFKGQYTKWLYEILHLFLQPTLEGILNDAFDLYDDTIPLVHLDHVGPNLATLVASNLIVGFILSPLELIKTRLQVQSNSPLQRKYNGPFHALRTIIQEEGLYASHNHLPTILYHTIVPLFQNTIPLIIDRVFRVSVNDSPFVYHLAELGLNTLEILITIPLDTIRKRLQCQVSTSISGNKRYETVVALRPVPYTGMANAAYCIMKEEGSRSKSNKKNDRLKRKSIFNDWSLRGLYHGFNMQCTSNIALFFLHTINSIEDEYEEF